MAMFLLLPLNNCQNISCQQAQYYFSTNIWSERIFNIASLIENCLTSPRIPHTYATTTIYHEKVYRVVFYLQENVV